MSLLFLNFILINREPSEKTFRIALALQQALALDVWLWPKVKAEMSLITDVRHYFFNIVRSEAQMNSQQ